MTRTLKIIRRVEIVLGILLALRVLVSGSSDLGVLYVLVLFIFTNGPLCLVGAWAAIFRPGVRKLAISVVLLPVGFLVVPLMVRGVLEQPLSTDFIVIGLVVFVALVLAWALVRPRQASQRLPASVLRKKWLNVIILSLPVLGWMAPILAYIVLAASGEPISGGGGSPGTGAAIVLIFAAVYLVGLGMVSLLTAAWGWIGYRGAASGERLNLHLWQMITGLPGAAVGVLAAALVGGQ